MKNIVKKTLLAMSLLVVANSVNAEIATKYIGKIRKTDDAKYIKFEMAKSLPVVESKVNNEKFVFSDEKFMKLSSPVSLSVMFPSIGSLKSRLKEEPNRPSMQLINFVTSSARIIADSGLETLSGVQRIAYAGAVSWYYPTTKGYTAVEYVIKARYATEENLSDFVKSLINNSLSQVGVSADDKAKWMKAIDQKEYLSSFLIMTPESSFKSVSRFDWNKINYLKESGIEYESAQGKKRVSFALLKADGSLVVVALENRMK
jgi:hypothetical protein